MEPLTLESLSQRVAALETEIQRLNRPTVKDWRSVVGTFEDTEFSRLVDAEGRAWRERERQADLEALEREAGK